MPTLDLTSGYFQIAKKFEDIVTKTAFIKKSVCYAFKRTSFDLSGAPCTFQKAMNKIFKPLLGKEILLYLEDKYRHGGYF